MAIAIKDILKEEITSLGNHLKAGHGTNRSLNGNSKFLDLETWGIEGAINWKRERMSASRQEAQFSSGATGFQNMYHVNNIIITLLQMKNLDKRQWVIFQGHSAIKWKSHNLNTVTFLS